MSLADIRPQYFEDVVGQKTIVKMLRKIVKNPDKYPHNIILVGAYGTGKTTCARIFQNEMKLAYNAGSHEFDSSDVNKDAMKEIKNLIQNVFLFDTNYRVLLFDEVQEINKASQDLLLQILEDNADSNVFFLFTTTNIEKLEKTIRSRNIKFVFNTIESDELKEYLKKVCDKEKIEISDENLNIVVTKSKGHVRDALYLLDTYLLAEDDFKLVINDTTDLLRGYIFNRENNLNKILSYPVNTLKEDLNALMSKYIEENIDKEFMFITNFFETYMKYKMYIETAEDMIGVINILQKSVSLSKKV